MAKSDTLGAFQAATEHAAKARELLTGFDACRCGDTEHCPYEDMQQSMAQFARAHAATGHLFLSLAGRAAGPVIETNSDMHATTQQEATAAGDPDLTADAMNALTTSLLATVPAGQRSRVNGWLIDLLDLATDNLSPGTRTEVIRQALAGQPDPATDAAAAAGPAPRTGDKEVTPPGILLTDAQLREWAGLGRDLTGPEMSRLCRCIPRSSIPDAIGTIVTEALRLPPADDEDTDEPDHADAGRLTDLASSLGLSEADLDEYVHDLVSRPASDINDGGVAEQVAYVALAAGLAEAERMIREAAQGWDRDARPLDEDRHLTRDC